MSSDTELVDNSKPSFDKSIRMAEESAKEAPDTRRISRQTKPPTRFEMNEKVNSSADTWSPKPGPGKPLGSIVRIRELMKQYPSTKDPFLKDLHILLYNRPGREFHRRRNVMRFSGFCEANGTADGDSNLHRALKMPLRQIRKLGNIFGLKMPADKAKAARALVTFLEKPDGLSSSSSGKKKANDNGALVDTNVASIATGEQFDNFDEDSDDEVGLLVALAQPAAVAVKRKREDAIGEPTSNEETKAEDSDALLPPPAKKARTTQEITTTNGKPGSATAAPAAPSLALSRDEKQIQRAIVDFYKGLGDKAPKKPTTDLLIGYLYGRLGFRFAVDKGKLIRDAVSAHLSARQQQPTNSNTP